MAKDTFTGYQDAARLSGSSLPQCSAIGADMQARIVLETGRLSLARVQAANHKRLRPRRLTC